MIHRFRDWNRERENSALLLKGKRHVADENHVLSLDKLDKNTAHTDTNPNGIADGGNVSDKDTEVNANAGEETHVEESFDRKSSPKESSDNSPSQKLSEENTDVGITETPVQENSIGKSSNNNLDEISPPQIPTEQKPDVDKAETTEGENLSSKYGQQEINTSTETRTRHHGESNERKAEETENTATVQEADGIETATTTDDPSSVENRRNTEEINTRVGENTTDNNKEENNGKEKKCKPVENVVFVKTHKTGSSTILNIIQRYTEKQNLSMVLPRLPVANHMLGWPYRFDSKFVFEHEAGRTYNMFANHARFNKQKVLGIMKDPGRTKFVTILREPMSQLESSAVYFMYNIAYRLPKENLTEHFLNSTVTNHERYWNISRRPRKAMHFLMKNPNAFDLGHRTWVEDEDSVSEIVGAVKKDIDLVMISDRMLESLVLLKDELCWDLEDVVYFTLNKRPKQQRQRVVDTPRNRDLLKNWNNIDYALFREFNRTLLERIEAGGDRFRSDVERLRQLNRDLEEKCIDHGVHYDKSQPWFPILGYKLKNTTMGTKYHALCQSLIRPEIEYNNHMRQRQSRRGWEIPIRSKKKSK